MKFLYLHHIVSIIYFRFVTYCNMEAAGTAIDTFDAIQLGQNELSVSFSKETKKVHDIEDDGDDDEDDFYDKLYEDDDLGFR